MTLKKQHPKFNIPNFGTKSRKRVKARWRKQRGIDSKKRVRKAFAGAEPAIGYKNPGSISGIRYNGRRLVLVHNSMELNAAMEGNRSSEVDIAAAKSVGRRKRAEIKAIAAAKGFRVINA